MKAEPFIKWAGGKGQLLYSIDHYLPKPMPKNYAELFLGGGAVFFNLSNRYSFNSVLLNDLNSDLISLYKHVAHDLNPLTKALAELQTEFISLDTEERTQMYNKCRNEYNNSEKYSLYRSALFVFLNKTCFNGLYRVNKSGKFNTPMGDYKNPKICDPARLSVCSCVLNKSNTSFMSSDFDSIDEDLSDYFIYLDPPYRPETSSAKFTQYTKSGFNDEDQVRLAKQVKEWHNAGARIMISHPYQPDYFKDLYPDFKFNIVEATRNINCNGAGRSKKLELLMINYDSNLS